MTVNGLFVQLLCDVETDFINYWNNKPFSVRNLIEHIKIDVWATYVGLLKPRLEA
jgi:hypothetical protein